jgi:hypothetical protein
MHMAAAHGPRSAEYQRRSAQLKKQDPHSGDQRFRGKGKSKRAKPSSKTQLKHPRLSKMS